MKKTIYDLELHEEIDISSVEDSYSNRKTYITVKRVPGGWIYTTIIRNLKGVFNERLSSVFVPYDNKFQI